MLIVLVLFCGKRVGVFLYIYFVLAKVGRQSGTLGGFIELAFYCAGCPGQGVWMFEGTFYAII